MQQHNFALWDSFGAPLQQGWVRGDELPFLNVTRRGGECRLEAELYAQSIFLNILFLYQAIIK